LIPILWWSQAVRQGFDRCRCEHALDLDPVASVEADACLEEADRGAAVSSVSGRSYGWHRRRDEQ
jgi:hypothetical protein